MLVRTEQRFHSHEVNGFLALKTACSGLMVPDTLAEALGGWQEACYHQQQGPAES